MLLVEVYEKITKFCKGCWPVFNLFFQAKKCNNFAILQHFWRN